MTSPSSARGAILPDVSLGDRGWRVDAVWVTSVVLALTFCISQQQVFEPLGAAGRPALLVGFGMFTWWVLTRFHPELATHGVQPVRTLIFVVLAVHLLAYAAGYDRGLDELEATATNRDMLTNLSLAGVALCVADGVRSRERLDVLLGRLVLAGTFMASVGIVQAFASFDLAQYLVLPGLSWNNEVYAIGTRGDGVVRVAGTARHYIEFGAACAMIVPVAVHRARFAPSRGRRQARWLSVALLAGAVPLSVSRTGIVALVLALGIYALRWGWRARMNALVLSLVGSVAMAAVIPGLLGTFAKLFLNASDDPSVQARQDDYAPAAAYIADRPWLGRGPGTFLPDRYILLDNQYLYTTITEGYVGLVTLIVFFLTAIVLALHVARRAADAEARDIAQALAGMLVAGAAVSLTFDSFSFAVFATLVFLALGCVGALWRLCDQVPDASRPRDLRDRGTVVPGKVDA